MIFIEEMAVLSDPYHATVEILDQLMNIAKL